MSKHKTVHIKALIETVNARNRLSICSSEIREDWNSILEEALHAANVYQGYRYLSDKEVPPGHLPGYQMEKDAPPGYYPGFQTLPGYGTTFPDETRREYVIDRHLTGEKKIRKVLPGGVVSYRDVSRLPEDPMGAHGTLPSGEVL